MKRKDIQPIYAETYRRRKRTRKVVFGIFLLILVLGSIGYAWRWHQKQVLEKYPIRGVSINQNNGYIDFESLKNRGVRFVYIKATQGAAFTDDSFLSNFQRSQGSQLPVGVYHYFSFSSSPTAQFKNFVRQVKFNTGSLPICITIQYYGTYNEGSVHWQSARKNMRSLVHKMRRYYQRPVVISATRSILSRLEIQASAKRQFWVTDGQLGRPNGDATFLQATNKQDFRLDHQVVFLPMAVFNGNTKQWHQYLDEQVGS
ncbi:GH25 family lysozyme [Lentilactobacillus diolivorans]|jgi:lysozyme|uniref:GH25 family lysozyme n=1 Tax=Lentilactobacillus diolivorans TaxID=179838 RepID=UPI000FEE9592|nr:GH25 family lysozyme [Lentilactobacillus diolivorans]MDH5104685.1 GH25 family lysozyme [Lentilactobacillus diolivorans]RRG00932.1 MAG: lysozyme [Lactobacillus sp.]